jgi:hypothetical protein
MSTPSSQSPLNSFYVWVESEHHRLYLEVRKLQARTREIYPLVAFSNDSVGISQSWTTMCGQLVATEIEFERFESVYIITATGQYPDLFAIECPNMLLLWERYQSTNKAATSANS